MRCSFQKYCAFQKYAVMALGLVSILFVTGCPPKDEGIAREPDYWRELGAGEKALVKLTDPATWPDFHEAYERRGGLEQAALYSLEYLSKPSSKKAFPYLDVDHARAVASNEAFIELIRTARSADEFDQMIKERFDIYQSRGYDDKGTVLYTGYYRPIFDARMVPDARFRYPLYKRPADLERDPATGEYGRKGGGAYLTRGQISAGALEGQGLELCYLSDPFEAYIVTVQGSGRLRLADGSLFDIGYHGDNGQEYASIAQLLVDEGKMERKDVSLPNLIRYFKENPSEIGRALDHNPRYVFFTQREGGPFGSLNCPVTPFRTIATDKEVYPAASVAFVDTKLPNPSAPTSGERMRYRGFAMDQDTGGAIRAAGRCDIFLGTGPEMGEIAGRTYSEGALYYIFVR